MGLGLPSCVTVRPGRGRIIAAKTRLNAVHAELFLDLLEHRADLLHGLADLVRLGLEGTRPVVEGLGLELDQRRSGRYVFRALVGHCALTGLFARGSPPYRLEEADAGGDRNVEALGLAPHRDAHQEIARLR